jgi:uncharacterized NAD(P)/FAD-binding protein YdhS
MNAPSASGASTPPSTTRGPLLEWVIVGGGVHGTYLSHVLVASGHAPAERIRVVDPEEAAVSAFFRMTEATGMRYLRSPSVHHLDLDPYALKRFARRGEGKRVARFVPPYDRPGLPFFRAHTAAVVRQHSLDAMRVRARALRIDRSGASAYRVETNVGPLESRRVLLAIGLSEQPCVPEWAQAHARDPRVSHLFDPGFDRRALTNGPIVVVGGGISAAQLACALAMEGRDVTLVSRHPPRVHRFDSDPAWLGPKGMAGFDATPDTDQRRAIIKAARHRGSMPPEVLADLHRETRMGRLRRLDGEVARLDAAADGIDVVLSEDGAVLRAQHIVLATGFDVRRPGGALVDDAIERFGLPCAACGYPIVSRRLEWSKGLFVTGPLAELELGPTSRNIAGARAAGQRLVSAA